MKLNLIELKILIKALWGAIQEPSAMGLYTCLILFSMDLLLFLEN